MFIDETEQEDFETAIQHQQLNPADFAIETEPAPQGSRDGRLGKVTVRYRPSGVKRSYVATRRRRWSDDFVKELRSGVFGR